MAQICIWQACRLLGSSDKAGRNVANATDMSSSALLQSSAQHESTCYSDKVRLHMHVLLI